MDNTINQVSGNTTAYVEDSQSQGVNATTSAGQSQSLYQAAPAGAGAQGGASVNAFSPALPAPKIDPGKAAVLLTQLELNQATTSTQTGAELIKSNEEAMQNILQQQLQQEQQYNNEVSQQLTQQKQQEAQQKRRSCHGFFGCLGKGFKDLFTGHVGDAIHCFTHAVVSGGPVADVVHAIDKGVGDVVGDLTHNKTVGKDVEKALDFATDFVDDPLQAVKNVNTGVGTIVGDISGSKQAGQDVTKGLGILEQIGAMVALSVMTAGAGDAAVAADAAGDVAADAAGDTVGDLGETATNDLGGQEIEMQDFSAKPDADVEAGEGDDIDEDERPEGEKLDGEDPFGASQTDALGNDGDDGNVEGEKDKEIKSREKKKVDEELVDLVDGGSDGSGATVGDGAGKGGPDMEIEMQDFSHDAGLDEPKAGEADEPEKSEKTDEEKKSDKSKDFNKKFARVAVGIGGISGIDNGVNQIETAIENDKIAQDKGKGEKAKAAFDYLQAVYDNVDQDMQSNLNFVKDMTKTMAPDIQDALNTLNAFAAANAAPMGG